MSTVHDFIATTGPEKPLSDFSGQVRPVVNTASKCGFTPQYEGLEALYRKYNAKGFAVLSFPCNQFGVQELGDAAEVAQFCSQSYSVTFRKFHKIDVKSWRGSSVLPISQGRKPRELWEQGRSNGILRNSLSVENAG